MAGPCAVVDGLAVAAGLLGEFEEECEDVLGDRVGAVAGDVDDGDAAASGGGGVDDIEACGEDPDAAEIGEGVDDGGGEWRFVSEDDVGVAGAIEDEFGRRAVVDGEVAEGGDGLPVEIAWVEREAVEDNDAWHWGESV